MSRPLQTDLLESQSEQDNVSHYCLTRGGGGRFVPRGRLYGDVDTHDGIASALATRQPTIALTSARVRGPSQFQSGRTVSVVW